MSTKQNTTPVIGFKAQVATIGAWTILRLPKSVSAKLPSRGQVMVEGEFNGHTFQTALEPDGAWGHWFKVDDKLHAKPGDSVTITITPMKEWPEPDVPADWQQALRAHPKADALWHDITPMARWEWIRWIRSTDRDETRKKRIEVGCSKLESGERRPCCWNRNLCTEPAVSKNGVLLGAS